MSAIAEALRSESRGVLECIAVLTELMPGSTCPRNAPALDRASRTLVDMERLRSAHHDLLLIGPISTVNAGAEVADRRGETSDE
jgi:hypothetical protein